MLVSPFLISKKKELSSVNDNLNAIIIYYNEKNKNILLGEGAGGRATAISVISDLLNLSNNTISEFMYGVSHKKLKKKKICSNLEGSNSFYIRVKVYDKSGAIASITTILKNYKISIKSLFQEQINKKFFNVVILTHKCKGDLINKVTLKLNNCYFVKENAMIMQVLHV